MPFHSYVRVTMLKSEMAKVRVLLYYSSFVEIRFHPRYDPRGDICGLSSIVTIEQWGTDLMHHSKLFVSMQRFHTIIIVEKLDLFIA